MTVLCSNAAGCGCLQFKALLPSFCGMGLNCKWDCHFIMAANGYGYKWTHTHAHSSRLNSPNHSECWHLILLLSMFLLHLVSTVIVPTPSRCLCTCGVYLRVTASSTHNHSLRVFFFKFTFFLCTRPKDGIERRGESKEAEGKRE